MNKREFNEKQEPGGNGVANAISPLRLKNTGHLKTAVSSLNKEGFWPRNLN